MRGVAHYHGQLLILASVPIVLTPKKIHQQSFIAQTTNFLHLISLNLELSKKKVMQNSLEGQQPKIYFSLGQQETYVQKCTHIYTTELCKNQLQLAHGHESMFETTCLPIIIAEIGGLILENGKESQECG